MGKAIRLQDVVVGAEKGPGQEIDDEHFHWFIEDFKDWLWARYGWVVCTGEFHLIEPSNEGEGEEEEE